MEEKDYIFTFGCGQQHAGHFVRIKGTFTSARNKMFELFGEEWAFQYEADEYFKAIENLPIYYRETEMELC